MSETRQFQLRPLRLTPIDPALAFTATASYLKDES